MSFWQAARALDALSSSAGLVVGLDFDGTLAPIAAKPGLARLPEASRRILARLARKPQAHVAIVSGRALADVRARVGLPGITYAGDHGLEIEGPLLAWRHPQADRAREELARLIERLRREVVVEGVLLESKALTASVHYRLAAPSARRPLRAKLSRAIRGFARRFRILPGNRVWEIRPRARWDKGRALLAVAARVGRPSVLAIGDDVTDEEGFRTLGPDALTIRVGGSGPTHARFRVQGPEQVRRLLDRLCRRLPG